MKNGKKIFWGVFFILIAVYMIVSKLGMLPDVGVLKILVSVALACVILEGIRRLNFFEILFPVAFLAIMYDETLGIEALTPWTVLAAALFGSIGLSMIFRVRKKSARARWNDNGGAGGESTQHISGEQIWLKNNFGEAIRYINSDDFHDAHLEKNFGSMSAYFDNVLVQGGEAYIEIDNNFGELSLYLPKEWQVQNNLEHSFVAIHEKGKNEGSSSTLVRLDGDTNFGEIHIIYV